MVDRLLTRSQTPPAIGKNLFYFDIWGNYTRLASTIPNLFYAEILRIARKVLAVSRDYSSS